MTASLRRGDVLRQLGATAEWDVIVIGGGATGLGTALEAVARGYRTLLLEAHDFAKGTSSRSTKLVHGGVRYLQQGNLKLVLEALRERGRMLRNAPHLVHRLAFLVPAYSWGAIPFYGIGLTAYDLLAGKQGLGRSHAISSARVSQILPSLSRAGLRGGILYYDGQFDDARFAIALLRTLFDAGGLSLNYAPVSKLLKRAGKVCGVVAEDTESGARLELPSKVVINATGIFADGLRSLDHPAVRPVVTVSQGTHIVLPRSFLPGNSALMVPRTSDGRVLFAIPWHDRIVVGTTDDPVQQPDIEPRALPEERQFLLAHIERYLGRRPGPEDILSIWSGQRPLVRQSDAANTAQLSRDHTILISESNFVTIVGGKWTTYRRMAEDVVDRAAPLGGLPHVPSQTANLKLHGWIENPLQGKWDTVYGSDLPLLHELTKQNPELNGLLHPALPFRMTEVIWAARWEMARSVEDVLARRTRALFLDAQASLDAAPAVARLLAAELGRDENWQQQQLIAFRTLASQYTWKS